MDQQAICDMFNREVSATFPNAYVKAIVWNALGESTLLLEFASSKTWAWNIIRNDPLHMRLLVQKDKGGWMIEGHMFAKRVLKSVGVNIRKISGKTEEEVVRKVIDWFIKNQEGINAVTKN